MNSIDFITLEVADTEAAADFYASALGLDKQVRLRAAEAPTSGFRGFTVSLVVSQPSTVNGFVDAALAAGATALKPVAKSLWGYGGVVQAPDGSIWKVASSEKKDTGPDTRQFDKMVLLLGAEDVAASKKFYVEHGLTVAKSYGRKYVEFALPGSPVGLGLYGRKALAKDAGVSPEGSGAHRLAIGAGAGPFTDPDGFAWETAEG
ncbi:VOC family protein [Actinacidiphila rubida]|nr:glyoxalase [Actinacidiphila rubida]